VLVAHIVAIVVPALIVVPIVCSVPVMLVVPVVVPVVDVVPLAALSVRIAPAALHRGVGERCLRAAA